MYNEHMAADYQHIECYNYVLLIIIQICVIGEYGDM